jgi:hypothetical protein
MDWLIISVVTIYVIVLVLGVHAGVETYLAWYRRQVKSRSPHGFAAGSKPAGSKQGRAA